MAQNPFLIEEETTAPVNPFVPQPEPVAVNPFLVQEEQPVAQANPFLIPEEPVVPEALTTDFGDVTSERTYPIAEAETEAGVNPFAALEVIDRPRAAVASSLIATLENSDAETIKAEAAKGISGEQHPMMGEYFSKKAKQVVENPTEYPTLSKVFSGVDSLFSEAVKKYQVGMTPIRLATSGVYADMLKYYMADTDKEKADAKQELQASMNSVMKPLTEAYTSNTAGLDALAYTAGFGVDVAIDPVTYTNPILSFTKKGKILIPDAVLDQYAKAANTTKQKAKDVLTRTKTGQSLTEAANYAWNLFSTKNQFKNKPKVEELRENFLNLIASGRVQAIREGREFQDRIKVFARETGTTEKEVEMFITEAVERGGVNNVKLAELSDEAINMLSKDDNIRYEVWSLSQRNADQLAKEIDAGVTITPLSEQPLLRVGDEDDALLLAYFNRAVTPDARKAINAKREAKGYKPIAEGGEGPTNMSGRHSSTIARNEEWEGLTINDINEMAKRGELPGYEGQVFKDGFFYSDPAVSQALRDSKHYRAIASRDLADQIIDPSNNISIAPDKLIQAARKSGWQPKTKNPTVVGALRYLKKNRKGWERWEVSNNPMTEGYVMDREIVDFVDGNLNKIYDPQEINKFLDVTDQVTNWWKAWTLSIFPSYHFRNEVGNVWNNFVMDVNPKFYQEAAKIQEAVMGSQITPPRWGKVGRTPTVSEGPLPAYTKFKTQDGTEYTYTQLRDMMDEQGIIGKGFMATDIESTLRSEMGDAKWLTLSKENRAIEVGKRIGEGLENNARMANFLDGLNKGLSPEQAAARVRKTLFDYSDLTKFEQDVMKRIMPFYTWTRKNVPFQIEQMIKKPGRYKAIDTLRQEIEAAVSEEDTNERYLASWMLENMPTKVKIDEETGEPRYFILGGWLPAADAWKLAAAPARVFKDNLHPGIKLMYERISADEDGYVTDLFTGQKLHPKLQQNFVGVDMPETVAHDLKNIRLLATMDDFIQSVRNSESDQKIIKVLQGDHILGKAEKKLSPFARQPKTVEESLIAFLTGFRTYAVNLDQQKMFAGMDEEQKIQQLQKLYMQSAKRGSAQPELIEEAKDVATEAQQKFATGGLISQLRKRYAEGGAVEDPESVSTEGVDMSGGEAAQEALVEFGLDVAPVTGEYRSGEQAIEDFKEGKKISGTINTIGAIPLVGGIVRGAKALMKGADAISTTIAKASDEGKDVLDIIKMSKEERQAWRDANKVKQKQSQTPELAEQAQKLFEGKVTGDEFRAKAAELRPHTTFTEVTKMPSYEEIIGSLKESQLATGIVGLNKTIPDGTEVASRLDIPAYEGFDTWVVSLHDSGGRTPKGKSIGYGKTALLNDVDFGTSPKGALSIARNKTNKTTIGRIYGKWENHDSDELYATASELIKDPEWTQVGMNPYRASYFYDKKTLEPVVSADQVVQVGPLVLAKGIEKASPNDPRFRFDKNSEQTFADGGLAEEADGNLNEGIRPEMDIPVEQPQQEVVVQAEQPEKPSIKMPPKQQKKDHVEEYLDNLAMVESSGNKNAYAETSGALGLYQFVPKTWEAMVDRYMPELKQQKGDYMEFRRNPEVSRYMARKLMEENQNILKKKGFNDTKGNLYLAHFAGPGAALNVLRAKPNTPVQDVLSAGQIKRNPGVFSKVKTTDQLIKWAQSKILLEKFKQKKR